MPTKALVISPCRSTHCTILPLQLKELNTLVCLSSYQVSVNRYLTILQSFRKLEVRHPGPQTYKTMSHILYSFPSGSAIARVSSAKFQLPSSSSTTSSTDRVSSSPVCEPSKRKELLLPKCYSVCREHSPPSITTSSIQRKDLRSVNSSPTHAASSLPWSITVTRRRILRWGHFHNSRRCGNLQRWELSCQPSRLQHCPYSSAGCWVPTSCETRFVLDFLQSLFFFFFFFSKL